MSTHSIYDIIGIGIGPFNLGLAALTEPIKELKCLFLEKNKEFHWHPGLMLDNARLQVPFYADLVTLADPCSKYSYMAFLKAKGRMFRFAILEESFILRGEYNEYCRWVVEKMQGPSPDIHRDRDDKVRFGIMVEAVHYDEYEKVYSVYAKGQVFYGKNLVIGVGSTPHMPRSLAEVPRRFAPRDDNRGCIFHSSEYLEHKLNVLGTKSVAIIGSGQSAAEIFYDLLKYTEGIEVKWFTRSDEFFPMDYSAFALERTSPDYIDYFFGLGGHKRERRLRSQDRLYKGINMELIKSIYQEMYFMAEVKGFRNFSLHPNAELRKLEARNKREMFDLTFYHNELDREFGCTVGAVILATGYKYEVPGFIDPIRSFLQWDEQGRYRVNRNYSIDQNNSVFVQNAELHSHGFNAPDLGMGPYRNATILNSILGYEYFVLEKEIAFQKFGLNP